MNVRSAERQSIRAGGLGLALVLLAGPGCDRQAALAPPDIRYGEEMCARCGMIINDDRFAATLIRESDRGNEELLFDDIGCLFLHEQESPGGTALAHFVRDGGGGGWVELERAFYVHHHNIETPMAFGIAAFASRSTADAKREEVAGRTFEYAELLRWIADDPAALHPLGDFSSAAD